MPGRYLLMSLVAVLICCGIHAQEEYALEAFRITANAPVTVTLSHAAQTQKPMYRPPAGDWKPLDARQQEGALSFVLPADAVGETLVLLTQPDWLTLPDGDAPQLAAARIGGVAVTPEGSSITCGAVAAPPAIELTVADAQNPILHSRVSVQLNGMPIEDSGGRVLLQPADTGRSLAISVLPGELLEDRYIVSVSVPDASPARNTLVATVSFSTAPLLRNGGFEAVSADGKPENWSVGSWGGSDPGDYKISVAEGQGRSGNALCLQGISGRINMVVGQPVDMVAGSTYILSGYAKGDGVGYASLIAADTGDGKQQYDNTGRTAASADWQPFAWELKPQPGKKDYTIYLRNASVGTVYFDDLRLDMKPQ